MPADPLAGRRLLLIVGGGIAAYKSLDLIRRFRERGVSVRGVMTRGAKEFVTPLSVASLTGQPVHDELFSLTDEAEMGHIELSRAADLVVVAPATANLMAKLAHGLADDLASTLLLATDKRTLLAPAMNLRMWLHPATARNLATLRRDGVLVVGPNEGAMACGEFGPGRMAEPLEIVAAAEAAVAQETVLPLPPDVIALQPGRESGRLRGRRVIVTSGPTQEPFDPVRFIANRSSGRQGHAIAAAAAQAGADVTLVSGPVNVPDPVGVHLQHVETAREMLAAVEEALPADLFVGAAAVADWRPATQSADKLKKGRGEGAALTLVPNPDILATVARHPRHRPALVVGFAAETADLLAHAQDKLQRKGCDLIVANDVSPAHGVMGGGRNTVHLVSRDGVMGWPTLDKTEVARRLVERCADLLDRTPA